jgi:hypothetical protein
VKFSQSILNLTGRPSDIGFRTFFRLAASASGEGRRLTVEIKRLAKKNGQLKIAVAYWGSGGLKLLGLP